MQKPYHIKEVQFDLKKTYLYAGISIFCWSTVATISKLLLGEINNIQLLWISSAFAALFLLIINIATGRFKKNKDYKPKDYLTMTIIGLPGTFFYYIFYYAGTDILQASQAFIINYLWPIMSVLFACVILKETLSPRKIIAIIISFVGVAIVMGGELNNFNKNTLLGAICCILGAVSYGIFTSLNKKMNYDKPLSLMTSYFATFFLTSLINIINGDLFLPEVNQTLGFIWNGVFTVAIANTLWVMALESGKTAKISNLAYITPFASLIWTSIFLKDEITIFSILGLVIIISGIFIQINDNGESL